MKLEKIRFSAVLNRIYAVKPLCSASLYTMADKFNPNVRNIHGGAPDFRLRIFGLGQAKIEILRPYFSLFLLNSGQALGVLTEHLLSLASPLKVHLRRLADPRSHFWAEAGFLFLKFKTHLFRIIMRGVKLRIIIWKLYRRDYQMILFVRRVRTQNQPVVPNNLCLRVCEKIQNFREFSGITGKIPKFGKISRSDGPCANGISTELIRTGH